jgi:Domain of unknown function (DUF5069)
MKPKLSRPMKLSSPRETLAGCIWLPRILAKARLLKNGDLPADYEARFCHPTGVDGLFLAHFGLSREEIISAAALPDDRVSECFLARSSPARIEQWNDIALNLGHSGYPMADRFPVALATTYKHVANRGLTTVFEVLEADENGV